MKKLTFTLLLFLSLPAVEAEESGAKNGCVQAKADFELLMDDFFIISEFHDKLIQIAKKGDSSEMKSIDDYEEHMNYQKQEAATLSAI